MRLQERQPSFSFELWASQGSWFWHLSMSDGHGFVGAAPSADEAARDACESFEEIEPGACGVVTAPMLLESAFTWSSVLEGFGRALAASLPRCRAPDIADGR